MKKRIAILGSTGSIGRSTLDIVAQHRDRFQVVGLAAGENIELLVEQVELFQPEVVSIHDATKAAELRSRIGGNIEVLAGHAGTLAVASHPSVELVVSAIVGAAGLRATAAAIEQGKHIALANKESLVVGGPLITALVKKKRVRLLPVDSEHSAIFQSLEGHRVADVQRLILTASGGPFRTKGAAELKQVTVKEALAHPNWSMGKKITIDSATMMNKGLEVIEAHWLFGVPVSQIEVVIHPQSIVHSLVEYRDGCTLAQLGVPDMRSPIAYALAYPERIETDVAQLDLARLGTLTFEEPDLVRFPCLELAFNALNAGASMPAVLNAANEVAVEAFLREKIRFMDIPRIIAGTMEQHAPQAVESIEHLLEIDDQARGAAHTLVRKEL